MRRSLLCTSIVLLSLALPAAGSAQTAEHAASAETLDEIAVEHAATREAKRTELRAFLERPEVREIADQAGIDIRRAETAVASLSAEEIDSLSEDLAAAETALAGGDTLVISSTAIIIALLILILLLVAD